MNRAPAYQHYPDKAMSGTQHLSPEAFKAYWLMLWWMWLHSPDYCSIPDDPKVWAIAMQVPVEQVTILMDEIRNEYMPLLRKKGKKLFQMGLKKESVKQREWREKSSAGGRSSAKARKDKALEGKGGCKLVGTKAQPKSNTPSPSPTPAIPKKELPKIPDWLGETWSDFLSHRKQLRKPMTHEAQKRMLARVLKEGNSRGRRGLDMAMERGWQAPVWDHKELQTASRSGGFVQR